MGDGWNLFDAEVVSNPDVKTGTIRSCSLLSCVLTSAFADLQKALHGL